MRPNRIKQLLKQGQTVLGCGLAYFRSPEVPRLLAAAGLDWTYIDTEHGCFNVETVQDFVRTALLSTLTPLVRVADLQYSLIARALDMGAEGIVLPRVESPDLLARAISWTKFPGRGVRGYGLGPWQVNYENLTFQQIIDHVNENVLVILQIETQTALDRCDDLLAVPGVDIVMVGPADLSISLGVPGQFDHPKMIEAICGVIDRCRRHGIFPGIQCLTLPMAKSWKQRGMKFIGCGSEISFMLEKAREVVAQLREGE
jgi:2-dehydro-3-deoxyglucarate aldolase/4-hydroxy-2-oxoheptanedioate aldolase